MQLPSLPFILSFAHSFASLPQIDFLKFALFQLASHRRQPQLLLHTLFVARPPVELHEDAVVVDRTVVVVNVCDNQVLDDPIVIDSTVVVDDPVVLDGPKVIDCPFDRYDGVVDNSQSIGNNCVIAFSRKTIIPVVSINPFVADDTSKYGLRKNIDTNQTS